MGLARCSEIIDFGRVMRRVVYYVGCQIMGTADRWAGVFGLDAMAKTKKQIDHCVKGVII